MQEQPCRHWKQPYTPSLHLGHLVGEQLAGSGLTASRDWWHQTCLFLINKWRIVRLGTTRNVLQHSLFLGSIYFSFISLHLRHFEQVISFEPSIFKPTVCLAQKPELMLAFGQELQRIQLVDYQSLDNIERNLPLFQISVHFVLVSARGRTPGT